MFSGTGSQKTLKKLLSALKVNQPDYDSAMESLGNYIKLNFTALNLIENSVIVDTIIEVSNVV